MADPQRAPRIVHGERAPSFTVSSDARGEFTLRTDAACSGRFEILIKEGILMGVSRIETFNARAIIVPEKSRA